jgi:CHASE3 domain sensor protein
VERAIQRHLDEGRAAEWRRIAPGGTPLWVLPDQDLERIIDKLAASSRARTVEITYYMAEYDRRQTRRLNEAVAESNRSMVRLTRAIVALTAVVMVLTAVTVVLAAW